MPEITFPRSGQAPLIAECEIVAQASSKADGGHLASRWHDITLARTAKGRYVLGIEYRCQRADEPVGHSWAKICDGPKDVPPALDEYDPTQWVIGYPGGERFAGRQQKLLATIQAGYYAAAGRVLAACKEFAERVE